MLATPLGTAIGGPLAAWLGAQRTLLASVAATNTADLAATALLTTRPGRQPDSVSRGERSRSKEYVRNPL